MISTRIEGSGRPLLLINGLARPMASWTPFIRNLSGRTVIAFDAPGIGASPTPMFPVSMGELAAVALRVLDDAGFESADVVGYSHGGAVAQQLVADAPQRVRKLLLAATSCGLGAIPGQLGDLSRGMFGPAAELPWPPPDPLGLLWQVLAITTWTSVPELGRIGVPTLVVSGRKDRVVPPANSVLLAQRIPHARLAMIDGGHDLQSGAPMFEFAGLVQEFLDS